MLIPWIDIKAEACIYHDTPSFNGNSFQQDSPVHRCTCKPSFALGEDLALNGKCEWPRAHTADKPYKRVTRIQQLNLGRDIVFMWKIDVNGILFPLSIPIGTHYRIDISTRIHGYILKDFHHHSQFQPALILHVHENQPSDSSSRITFSNSFSRMNTLYLVD